MTEYPRQAGAGAAFGAKVGGPGPDLATTGRTERCVIRISMKCDHQTICLAACFLIAGAGGYCLQALY